MNWFPTQSNSDFVFRYNGNQPNPNFSFAGFSQSDSYESVNHQYFDEKEKINLSVQRKNDQDFINKFVLNKKQRKNKSDGLKSNQLKIFEAKKFLLEIIALKNKLETDAGNLCVSDENFDSKWEVIGKKMVEIDEKIFKFNTEMKVLLKTAIDKRLKKRKAIKKRMSRYKTLKEIAVKEIEEKNTLIDKLLSEKSDEVEAVKRESALKRQADTVLHEVRKKKYEAKKMMNMLSSLSKLRELRSKQEEEKGGYCSRQVTETFNIVINRFQKLWQKQMDVYKLEEKGLKIMLEENAMPYIKESKFETNLLQWQKVLFGDISNDENTKHLTVADDDIQALIQVRRDWDQFIAKESTAMASSIPPGWVLPPETENDEWKMFTKIDKKIQS